MVVIIGYCLAVNTYAGRNDIDIKETKSLGLGKLFGGKRVEQQKKTTEPESIIGATKTVILSDFKNDKKSQIVQKNKKPSLKTDNAIKPQQALQKNNKPKLGL